MQGFDWYLIATPLFATLIVLALVALKMSLKSQSQITQSMLKKASRQQSQQTKNEPLTALQKYQTLKVLNYLVRNYTFLQFCLGKKSSNKLPMLLSISVISILCLVNPSIIVNSFAGIVVTLCFVVCKSCFENGQTSSTILDGQAEDFSYIRQEAKADDKIVNNRKWLNIAYGILSCALSLTISGLCFKNYSNSFLTIFLKNLVISSIADLFAIRFAVFLIICFPCSFNRKLMVLIHNQKLREICAQNLNKNSNLKDCATNLSPRKKQSLSPTKIPKAVLKLNRQNSQTQALKNAMQIAKKIKKERNSQDQLMKTVNRQNLVQNSQGIDDQQSINHLFEESNKEKGKQSPIAMFQNQDQKQTNGYKTKRKDTDLVIVEFKRNQQIDENTNNQNQNQGDEEIVQRKATSFLHSNLDFEDDLNRRQENKIGQNRLNIIKLLNEAYEKQKQEQDEEDDGQNEQNPHRIKKNENFLTMNIERNDPLRVNDHGQGEIQEIDTNSPERRKRVLQGYQEGSQFKLKKKAKHFAGNAKRRVIKFSSGQPYLEYLPNMLAKDGLKHKKSQPIQHSKIDLQSLDDRRKSIKKSKTKKEPKFMFGGDENQHPGTMQALEVEDI